MRLDDGERALENVGGYLTVAEAQRAREVLADLVDQVAEMGFDESHGGLGDGALSLTLYVSKDAATQEAEFTARLDP